MLSLRNSIEKSPPFTGRLVLGPFCSATAQTGGGSQERWGTSSIAQVSEKNFSLVTLPSRSFSSEFYDPLFGNFTPGPRLPHPAHRHCAAEVSPGLVFLSGGIDDAFAERDEAYVFDVNDGTFQDLPPMPEAKYGHYCGVNRNPPSGRVRCFHNYSSSHINYHTVSGSGHSGGGRLQRDGGICRLCLHLQHSGRILEAW